MDNGCPTGTAMVFPGMGPVGFADVAKFMVINPHARELIAVADDRLGYSLVDRFRDGQGDYTEFAQVAFLVNCLALARWAERELGIQPVLCTGASFGAKTATAYVGSLSFSDAVWMTARLARCIDEYFSREHRDVVTHSFVRTPQDLLHEVLAELDEQGEWYDISCYLDHNFYMVSLRETNLEWLQQRVRAIGGLSLYTMCPPMHSGAFAGLRRKAEQEVIGQLHFADPALPVVCDHDGTLVSSADGIRASVLDTFVRPLRWPDVVATMRRLGVGTVYVSGPDSLFGRVRCTRNNFQVVAVNPRLALQPRRREAVT
jgi:[acyl-carrier-protein] S-malonyltransferase